MSAYRDIPPVESSTGPTPRWRLWLARVLVMTERLPSPQSTCMGAGLFACVISMAWQCNAEREREIARDKEAIEQLQDLIDAYEHADVLRLRLDIARHDRRAQGHCEVAR